MTPASNDTHSAARRAGPAPLSADIAIIGGGLAGLTLAIQLRQRDPALQVHVLERREHPVPEAAFKVGESTVEIGAHYLADVLGLRAHLDERHLRKFGFRFFFSDGRSDIDQCTELGVSRVLPTPSWQIDRGRFENFLGGHARALGARLDCGAVVRRIELSADGGSHRVAFDHAGQRHTLDARWLIDASGRAGLIKRKLGLARDNAHDCNAVWWRVTGHIDPQQWSDDAEWLGRCDPPDRWRSTNHLCGPGYWVWLIPLASGSHSIGIVCDARMHPLEQMNTPEKALRWLGRHQPRIARLLLEDARHVAQDFSFLRNYSYGCDRCFSHERWAITGEAGLFLDPFYSPGTDFIAIANTYICDLVARDTAGQPVQARAELYQILFESFYQNTLSIYQGQYALFGDPQVMPGKIIWDYTYYWALLAPIFFAGRMTDVALFSRLRDAFATARELNAGMQQAFRQASQRNAGPRPSGRKLLDQHGIEWFREMNRALNDPQDAATLEQRLRKNVACLVVLADEMRQAAAQQRQVPAEPVPGRGSPPAAAALLQPVWHGIDG